MAYNHSNLHDIMLDLCVAQCYTCTLISEKTIAIYKGFYIPGGTQVFGKFKKTKDCQKACEVTPNCFAADYNPWLKKCYVHTNITACEEMRTHPKLVHFKKIPCGQ